MIDILNILLQRCPKELVFDPLTLSCTTFERCSCGKQKIIVAPIVHHLESIKVFHLKNMIIDVYFYKIIIKP